jgi:ATP-dependent Clp protease, protease subunit
MMIDRKIYLFGEIDAKVAENFIRELHLIDTPHNPKGLEITVVLCSVGGDEAAGYAIYDALKMANSPIIVEEYGEVCSIASLIFQAGDIRRMALNAFFMIHSGSTSPGEDVENTTLLDIAEQIQIDNSRYYSILANNSNLSLEEVKQACEAETWYTAEQALTAGFCDEILVSDKKQKRKKKRS